MRQTNREVVPLFNLKNCSGDSGSALIFVVMLAFIGSLVIGAATLSNRYTLRKSTERKLIIDALSIAEAGKESALAKLRSRAIAPPPNTKTVLYSNEPFGNGTYSVSCSTNTACDTILIESSGTAGLNTVKLEILAVGGIAGGRWIKGAVTARTDVETLGSIQIDGRNYDTTGGIFGTLMGSGGALGIAAGGAVSIGGASTVGGNNTAPQGTPVTGETIVENFDTTGYPQTPEEVLELPPGSLDSYKCATCPPASYVGIVYTETPCDFAGGIYILHNSAGNASLDNYHGHFKGLIIADEVKHFNSASSVLGAVFMLGKTAAGNCFGNGAARIHYSSNMLNKVLQTLPPSGRRPVDVASWREVE